MAITSGGHSPIIMDAQGDLLSTIFQGRDMWSTGGVPKLCLVGVEFVGVAGGPIILTDGNGGQILFQSPVLGVGENYFLQCLRWVQEVYVDTMPAGSMVLLHYA